MLEFGLLDSAAFKKKINAIFQAYYGDSTHQWPNAKLQEDYWVSAAMQQLPYQRGLAFAFYLDESISTTARGTAGLKNTIFQMLAEARTNGRKISPPWILSLLEEATGNDYTNQLERFITKGIFIPIAEWEEVIDKLALLPARSFDLGFQTDKGMMQGAIVTAVDKNSNAAKAGLLGGRWLKVEGEGSSCAVVFSHRHFFGQ